MDLWTGVLHELQNSRKKGKAALTLGFNDLVWCLFVPAGNFFSLFCFQLLAASYLENKLRRAVDLVPFEAKVIATIAGDYAGWKF